MMKINKFLLAAVIVLFCVTAFFSVMTPAYALSCRDTDFDTICDCIYDPADPVYPNCEPRVCEPDWINVWQGSCNYAGQDGASCNGIGYCTWSGEICELKWPSIECSQFSGDTAACANAEYCKCAGSASCQCEDDKDAACAVYGQTGCGASDSCSWNGTACVYVGDTVLATCSTRNVNDCLSNDYCRVKNGCSAHLNDAAAVCGRQVESQACEALEQCNWNGVCKPDYYVLNQCELVRDIDTCTGKDYCMWSADDCIRCTQRPDNCPDTRNADQSDADGDGVGDACDNCLFTQNPLQTDSDRIICPAGVPCNPSDGRGDACDNCPSVHNADQSDLDEDGIGDVCDMVDVSIIPPNPSVTDAITITVNYRGTNPSPDIRIFINGQLAKLCSAPVCSFSGGPYPNGFMYEIEYKDGLTVSKIPPGFFNMSPDADGDGISNLEDNCPHVANPDQADSEIGQVGFTCFDINTCIPLIGPDPDGRGDACDNCPGHVNPYQQDSDSDGKGNVCDNCIFAPNPGQDDTDFDTVGDPCDNCPDDLNYDQTDTDGDGQGNVCDDDDDNDFCLDGEDPHPLIYSNDFDFDNRGDDCDNCPGLYSNPLQEDLDNDGEGDACDCDDVNQGSYEDAIDCGGWACSPCIECTWCGENVEPVRIKGQHNSGKIDVVFVPHENYDGFMNDFEDEVINTIRNAVFTMHEFSVDPIPADYKDRFNFYRYTGGFATSGDCAPHLGMNFYYDAPFRDSAGVLSRNPVGGCASELGPPSRWIADGGDLDESIHEMMHSIFGLVDEYCGDTYYVQQMLLTNVWNTLLGCQTESVLEGWTGGTCRRICTDEIAPGTGLYWTLKWRYDPDVPDEDVMTCNCGTYQFSEADVRRINFTFNAWTSSNTLGVLMQFNMSGETMTFLSADVVDSHPDLGMQYPHFTGEIFSSLGDVIETFGIWDPRIELGEKALHKSNVDFTVIIPFHDGLQKFRINDAESGQTKVTVDLTEVLSTYCARRNYEDRECRTVLDLDGDGIEGMADNCPGVSNQDQTDGDRDTIGDACDNCRDVTNPDQRDTNSGEDDNKTLAGDQHYGNACDPDFDNDGSVTLGDFNVWRVNYRQSVPPASPDLDLDNDGNIGLGDFNIWRQYYRSAPGPGIGD